MEKPFVSILIPVRNEIQYIERCLEAVYQQDYPTDRMEVLISDGMSEDGTREFLADYANSHENLFVYDNAQRIVPTGLNRLIRQAKGEILIRVDGHCVIRPDYVSNCVKHLQSNAVDGVGGPMHTIGEDKISQVIALGMSSKFGVGGSAFRTETGQTKFSDSVPFPAYTRSIIEQVGLYDEELVRNQDDEYNYRIRKHGGKILLASDVRSVYYSRGSLKGLWKQYYQYGYWKVRVLQKHPRQMSLRQFIPPVFVLALLVCLLISIFFPWGWQLLVCLAGSYLLASMTVSVFMVASNGWGYLPWLPATFAVLHLSYGCGFLVGLVKFWNRWKDKQGRVPEVGLE